MSLTLGDAPHDRNKMARQLEKVISIGFQSSFHPWGAGIMKPGYETTLWCTLCTLQYDITIFTEMKTTSTAFAYK